MTLEDFEKALAEEKIHDKSGRQKPREQHHHRHHHESDDRHRHKSNDRHRHKSNDPHRHKSNDRHRHKRSKHSENRYENQSTRQRGTSPSEVIDADNDGVSNGESGGKNSKNSPLRKTEPPLKRDSWMEAPSSVEYVLSRRRFAKYPEEEKRSIPSGISADESSQNDRAVDDVIENDNVHDQVNHTLDYTFGDAGAQWRMTKLKAVFREAEETHRPVEDVALERFGDLRAFDDAREEQIELDRRETYGKGYAWKDKPSGDLFMERKRNADPEVINPRYTGDGELPEQRSPKTEKTISPQEANAPIDQTALNRMKAQMMKAKLRGSPNASNLEAEFNKAMVSFNKSQEPKTIVLNAMENRLFTSGRKGEVKAVGTRQGRERGLVEENEAMSIENMVKEERRTRNEAGGYGKRFAERIAKDGKFDNDLDYMDENATKLATRVHKSEINLKGTAISEFHKVNRILDNCPLCHREDENIPPIAPIVSLATRVYLTLPTEPEISSDATSIVPVQHRMNLLECDDDEWEEIRNFMKCLTQLYHDQGRDVIFYENAVTPQRRKHASMEAVPLPQGLGDSAPAFFKEAILSSDEEWTQHRKLIDTLSKANGGLGKLAFRRTLVKEMPYFHVWFNINGGLGHVVEDINRWPKGDLFAREVIGGMLDVEPHLIRKQGRWIKGIDSRVEPFRQKWKKFDWTRVLTSV